MAGLERCDDFKVVPHTDGIGVEIFLRMELLTSLPKVLRQQRLSEQEIIKLGKDISHALMLCESKNIIHYDIKPTNILVSKFGDYKLGDFGISRIMDHVTYATLMGIPDYQAPEVVRREKYDKTADIYSLGIILYWLLNNRKLPFASTEERMTSVIKNEAAKRRYRGEQLPPPRDGSTELKSIVLKACAYRPQDRYTSAGEVYQALEKLVGRQTAREIGKGESSSIIAGIHFGASEVCVSLYLQGECHTLFRMPAVFAISELGEILTGIKAIRYSKCHPDKTLYSVYEFIKEGQCRLSFEISYKGISITSYQLCYVLMKELRRNLDEYSYEEIRDCVVSFTSCNNLCMGKIKKVMDDTGFSVKRVISSSLACAIFEVFNDRSSRKFITCALEGSTLELSLADNSKSILKVLHTTELVMDSDKCEIGKSIVDYGCEQLKEEYSDDIGKLSVKVYSDNKSEYLLENTETVSVNLATSAAIGAAIQGAALSGILRENFLALDTTPIGFGLEIVEGQEEILRPLVWSVTDLTSNSNKSEIVIYDRKQGGHNDDNVILKVYMGHAYKEESEEVAQWYLSDICRSFNEQPEKLKIQLEVDESYVLSVMLTNLLNGETHRMDIMQYGDDVSAKLQIGKGCKIDQKEALVQIWDFMRQFRDEIKALDEAEKNSATGKGLLLIEKQCEQFLKKRGLLYAETSGFLKNKQNLEPIPVMADELLQIMDGFEYGIRNFSIKNIRRSEEIAGNTYQKLLGILRIFLGVTPIEAEGMLFDPNLHFAIIHVEDEKLEEGVVVEELQRGYYLGRQTFRPVKVKVAN